MIRVRASRSAGSTRTRAAKALPPASAQARAAASSATGTHASAGPSLSMDTSAWYATNGVPATPPHSPAASTSRPSDDPIHAGSSSGVTCRDSVISTCAGTSTVSTTNFPYISELLPDSRPRRYSASVRRPACRASTSAQYAASRSARAAPSSASSTSAIRASGMSSWRNSATSRARSI